MRKDECKERSLEFASCEYLMHLIFHQSTNLSESRQGLISRLTHQLLQHTLSIVFIFNPTQSMDESIFDVDATPPVFHRDEWIAKGKEYSSLPLWVQNVYSSQVHIPHQLQPHFPSRNRTVGEVLKMDIPQSHTLNTTQPSVWFSRDAPHTDLSCLKNRPIPDAKLLAKLEKHLPQMWTDGMQSVVDPRYNNGCDRLPLGVVKFWAGMKGVIGEKETWLKSKRWLDRLVEELRDEKQQSEPEVKEAQGLLDKLEWRTSLRADEVVATNFIYTQLLGDEWIPGDIIQLMTNCIAEQLESSRNADRVMLGGPEFARAIEICAYETYDIRGHEACLAKYATKIKTDDTQHLYFAANVNQNHWIAIHINHKRREWEYGLWILYSYICQIVDIVNVSSGCSMKTKPTRYLNAVKRWLTKYFPGEVWKEKGRTLPIGIQLDFFSCAIACMNAILHAIFKDRLWTPADARVARVQWFNRLVKRFTIGASPTPTLAPDDDEINAKLANDPVLAVAVALHGDHNISRSEIARHALTLPILEPTPAPAQSSALQISHILNHSPNVSNASPKPKNKVNDSNESTITASASAEITNASSMSAIEPVLPGASPKVKQGLLGWAILIKGRKRKQDDADISSLKSAESDSRPKKKMAKAIETLKSIGKRKQGDADVSSLNTVESCSHPKKMAKAIHALKEPVALATPMEDVKENESKVSMVPTKTVKLPKVPKGNSGTNRLARQQKKAEDDRRTRSEANSGTFQTDPGKLAKWTKAMKAINSNIELDTGTAKQFRHLTCGSDWLQCKRPYDTTWLNDHLKSCGNTKPKKTAGMPSVENWSKVFLINLKDQRAEPLEKVPCPGLTAADDPRISTYFERSGALYGGSESISVISKQLFGKLFSQLRGRKRRKQAIDTQNLQSKWCCDH